MLIVTEWIDGENLETAVGRAPLPPDEVARIGAAVADAIESLHRQDVIHLDIKPGNVLIRPDGRAVLIDFGLARHARLPDLMAEEMRAAPSARRSTSRRSRCSAFAPIRAATVRARRRAVRARHGQAAVRLAPDRQRPARPPVARPAPAAPAGAGDLPLGLQEVILRLIEPRPDQRYPSAAQVAFDLRHPDRVTLTARANKLTRIGFFAHVEKRLG